MAGSGGAAVGAAGSDGVGEMSLERVAAAVDECLEGEGSLLIVN